MATAVRTEDEAPLRFEVLELARRWFPRVRCRTFWIASLALFLKYYLVDRVHPNADRYWKRILRETDRSLLWWKPLLLADGLLTRLPGVRRLSWNIVLWGQKGAAPLPGRQADAAKERCSGQTAGEEPVLEAAGVRGDGMQEP